MLKKFFIYLMLAVSIYSNQVEKTAYIATFNVLRLGKNQKDYKRLAKAIAPFDIVGLVEVMDRKGLHRLLSELQKFDKTKWEYVISPYPVGTEEYKEYYAYIFKKDRVKHLKDEGFYPEKKNEFIREPYGATFKIDNFDFTFVLIHSIYGKSIAQREAEARKIIEVYNYFQNLSEEENDILIAGDFNLSATSPAFSNLLKHKDQIIYAVDPKIKTTIGTKGPANSYDNIFLSKLYTQEFTGESGALDITEGDFIKTRKEVSDHIPVFIKVNTEKDDD